MKASSSQNFRILIIVIVVSLCSLLLRFYHSGNEGVWEEGDQIDDDPSGRLFSQWFGTTDKEIDSKSGEYLDPIGGSYAAKTPEKQRTESRGVNDIIVLLVNDGFLDFTMNWMCFANRLNLDFTFVTASQNAHAILKDHGASVVLLTPDVPAQDLHGKKDFATWDYQALMNMRTRYVNDLLKVGKNVLIADVDEVWLDNPWPYIHAISDDPSVDAIAQLDADTACGGFLYLKSTSRTLTTWQSVTDQHNAMLHGPHPSGDPNTEQEMFKHAFHSNNLNLKYLDQDIFIAGNRFFDQRINVAAGTFPVMIHNNWVIGHGKKKDRFVRTGLWAWDESNSKCLISEGEDISHLCPNGQQPSFGITALGYSRRQSIERLLNSLRNADYEGDTVPLTIKIDLPAHGSTPENTAVAEFAKSFDWPHGPKEVIHNTAHAGLKQQWFNAWRPSHDENSVRMIVEDDVEVSKIFYKYYKVAVKRYLCDPDRDARIWGITLQRPKFIAGDPSRSVDVPGGRPFKYQLLGTWGQLVVAPHWSSFLSWVDEKLNANPNYNPSFSNLVTNTWWQDDQNKHNDGNWEMYFIRWVAENGYYNVVANIDKEKALSVNYQEAGVHYDSPFGADSQMVLSEWPGLYELPPSSELDVYDFQFRKVNEPWSLQFRKWA